MNGEIKKIRHKKFEIEIHGELTSTNDYLKNAALCGAADRLCAVAIRQTHGKGRLGRSFFSPEGGLYMSLLIKRKIPVSAANFLTPTAAVAVANALEAKNSKKIGIKWVNDLYADGKKVCGILTESGISKNPEFLDFAVVGIGINLNRPEGGFPEDIRERAGVAFEEKIGEEQKTELIFEILERLDKLTDKAITGDRGFVREYRERSVLIGREVEIVLPGEAYRAKVVGIDGDCALTVRTSDGEKKVFAGEAKVVM